MTFNLQRDKGNIYFYYYSPSRAEYVTQNELDNITLQKLLPVTTFNLYFAPNEVATIANRDTRSLYPENLIKNGSFEDGYLSNIVGDASIQKPGISGINANIIKDASDGSSALDLSTTNHTAYYSIDIKNYDPNSVYELSFDYKNIQGHTASICCLAIKVSEISKPSAVLRKIEFMDKI